MIKDKIQQLKEQMSLEQSKVEKMLSDAIKGLFEKDINLMKRVIEDEEKDIDSLELEIDRLCTDILALYQPEAGDLRTVLMISKMNGDIERIGDLTVNICRHGIFIIQNSDLVCKEDIFDMANLVIMMLLEVFTAFKDFNATLARSVYFKDSLVDIKRDSLGKKIFDEMKKDSALIQTGIYLIHISVELERIADLVTNICEEIIFISEGEVLKHFYLKK